MRTKIFIFLALLLALIISVPAVSAVSFDEPVITLKPDQAAYTPGDSISVAADLKLSSSGESTFPASHSLEAYTELDNPKWYYTILINGHGEEQQSTKKNLIITGYLLEYPADKNEISVRYRLEAEIPDVSTTSEKIFIEISQIDAGGGLVSGMDEKYRVVKRTVLNPEDITKLRGIIKEELDALETQIQTKQNSGVDVTGAQNLFNQAQSKYESSVTASYSNANTMLNDALKLIDEAEVELNRAWAQKAIDDAQSSITAIDFYLTDFKVNRSMTNDARVINIETKIESAQSSLNSAKSLMNDKNYAQAYTIAETSRSKSEEALTSAKEIYAEVSKGLIPDLGGMTIIFVIIAVVIIGVAGLLIYRRYSSWDELG
ncbi:hypothetical protein [Methanoplanus limicola]|uniref:Uncharacterized protein n=1 Tax=Methanoplanus limicola DSM 2279 TaxID=937775 RepID=H1Z497_9EURY|nr:hypothetical protein [Methanoplanus limicola]EHQ36645.1 hypothetical protein Metlim_2604 [Methanoplanus limicola DSM 2279]